MYILLGLKCTLIKWHTAQINFSGDFQDRLQFMLLLISWDQSSYYLVISSGSPLHVFMGTSNTVSPPPHTHPVGSFFMMGKEPSENSAGPWDVHEQSCLKTEDASMLLDEMQQKGWSHINPASLCLQWGNLEKTKTPATELLRMKCYLSLTGWPHQGHIGSLSTHFFICHISLLWDWNISSHVRGLGRGWLFPKCPGENLISVQNGNPKSCSVLAIVVELVLFLVAPFQPSLSCISGESFRSGSLFPKFVMDWNNHFSFESQGIWTWVI